MNSDTAATAINIRIGQGAKVHRAIIQNGRPVGAACNFDGFRRVYCTVTTEAITCAKCAK